MIARLLSVNVGLPREINWRGQTVRTAIWKNPVQGKRMVRRLNIEGDGQADLVGHGGEHRAVFVYQIDSYRYWQDQLHCTDFTFGQFGESFTIEGLPDTEVCIGDQSPPTLPRPSIWAIRRQKTQPSSRNTEERK